MKLVSEAFKEDLLLILKISEMQTEGDLSKFKEVFLNKVKALLAGNDSSSNKEILWKDG